MKDKKINMSNALLIGEEQKVFALGGFGCQAVEIGHAQGSAMLQQSPPGILFLLQLASKGDQQLGAVSNNIALKLERVAKACGVLVSALPEEYQDSDAIKGLRDVISEFKSEREAMDAAMAQARESKGDA